MLPGPVFTEGAVSLARVSRVGGGVVLDPALGRCSGTVRVHAGGVTRLTVLRRGGETCRLRTA